MVLVTTVVPGLSKHNKPILFYFTRVRLYTHKFFTKKEANYYGDFSWALIPGPGIHISIYMVVIQLKLAVLELKDDWKAIHQQGYLPGQ